MLHGRLREQHPGPARSSGASPAYAASQPPAPPLPPSRPDCRLRLTIAVLVPLAFEAASEERLYASHCRSRAAAGLPAEKPPAGVEPLYRAARWLAWEEGALHAAVVGWLLLALSWEWTRFAVGLLME